MRKKSQASTPVTRSNGHATVATTSAFVIPHDSLFDDEDAVCGFRRAPELVLIKDELITHHDSTFGHLVNAQLTVLWKRKGGAGSGKRTLGKTQRASGLIGFFGRVDAIIWLAADHCRDLRMTRFQIEALLYHELCHLGREGLKLVILPHDFQGFASEVRRYGLWHYDLESAHAAFRQLPLFAGTETDQPSTAQRRTEDASEDRDTSAHH